MELIIDAALNLALLSIEGIVTGWLVGGCKRGEEQEAPSYRLDVPPHPKVLHHGDHLMVVDKDYDLVVNHDNQLRPSVANQLKAKYPNLVDETIEVSSVTYFIMGV